MSFRRASVMVSYGPRGLGGSGMTTGMISAICSVARQSAAATQAAYVRRVVVPSPCPRRPATVLKSTPAARSSVAEWWRRACRRVLRIFRRIAMRRYFCVTDRGLRGCE
jgi:hypothetical protein